MLIAAMSASLLAGCGSSKKTGDSATNGTEAAGGSTASATSKTDKSTLSINIASEPDHLDPALTSSVDGGTLAANSFVGLFTTDADGKIQNALCDSYTVSDDGLTYTFTLKDGLKWSDGSDLTAADFEYSWKRAANPTTAADYSYLFDVFAKGADGNINVTSNGNTLTAVLANPCPYFLQLCAFQTFDPVPKAAVEKADPDGTNPGAWAAEAGFITDGAYTLQTWKHNESMVYVKNPNFYNADKVTMDKLEFMLSADDTATFAAYNAGNLDFIDSIPTDETSNVLNNKDFHVQKMLGTYFITFNVNADMFKGMTAEKAATVREALSILIDRDFIVENIGQTGQEIATSFIPTGMSDGNGGTFKSDEYSAYPDKDSNGYFSKKYDADKAKAEATKLLESVGYKFGDDGKLTSDNPITIDYVINENTGHQAVAEAVQSDWSAIGVTTNIKSEEWQTFLNDRKAGAFSVARDGWSADFDDPINMLEMWTSDSGNNNAQFGKDTSNTAAPDWTSYDTLINQIRTTTDFASRVTLMHQAEDQLMSTWAIVPIYYYNDPYMLKTNVTGVYKTKFSMTYFMYAEKK